MIQIHDIKPIVKIPDFSIYIYYGLFFLILLFCSLLIFLLYKYLKKKPKTKADEYYKILQNLDFTHSKDAAYQISKYGRLLATEERQIRLIEELDDALKEYKYKKSVSSEITENIKTKFQVFMESLDVR